MKSEALFFTRERKGGGLAEHSMKLGWNVNTAGASSWAICGLTVNTAMDVRFRGNAKRGRVAGKFVV